MQLDQPLVTKLPDSSSFFRKTFSFNIGDTNIRPEYWQAFTIIFLVFMIVLTIARWRHIYVKWNLQGFIPSVIFGFVLALILEGFLLIGGRTLFTELVAWENAPKPISTALDEGRSRLVQVLGASQEIPNVAAEEEPAPDDVIKGYESLTVPQASYVREYICK